MSEPIFTSTLATEMAQFVVRKRGQDFDYTDQAWCLTCFDRFLLTLPEPTTLLTTEIFKDYVASTARLTPLSRETRLCVVREFARYLHMLRPASALVPRRLLPVCRRKPRFYRLSREQIQSLMSACPVVISDAKQAADMRLLIGLLYCCGLRRSEALNLQLRHIDLAAGIVTVEQGKFRKDRYVPLSPSTVAVLTPVLAERRQRGLEQLLPYLTSSRAYLHFRRLCEQCDISDSPRCRMHDLRHNYASATLATWQEEGRDIEALLPVLSTVMGHVNSHGTQVYLHITDFAIRDAFRQLQPTKPESTSCSQ